MPPWLTVRLAGVTVSVKSCEGAVTVTLAVPFTLPLVAVTVNGPPALEPAVNRPEGLIEPPPLTDHVKEGCGLIGWPNWSLAVALNCCVAAVWTVAEVGDTVIDVSTGEAVTDTLAVPLVPPLDAVTVKGPPTLEPAVNRPEELIEPPPLTDHVNEGCGLIGWPNWSLAVALNC